MKRTAIDPSGQLGSLYDAYRDRLVGQLGVDNQEKLDLSYKTVKGEIKCGDDEQPQNLLRRLPINEQLRLSILLNLTPNGGIALLINYPHLINEYTRFFYYSSVDRVERLPDRIKDAEQFTNSMISSTAATHIITRIEWGVDLVIVLQLPSDKTIVKEIDNVLAKLLTFLLHDNIAYALTPDEESLVEKIAHTKVYANAPHLNDLTTIRDVCHHIKKNIGSDTDYPVSYTLRPINWLYHQYDIKNATFTSLSTELNDKIEKYVLQLTADFKKLEVSINEDTKRFLGEHWKQRFPGVQKQLLDMKDKFTKEIKRLSDIVVEIRSGQDENLMAKQIFSIKEQMVLQNPKDLQEKEQFQHLNGTKHDTDQTNIEMTVKHQSVEDNQRDRQNNSINLSDIIILPSLDETHEPVKDYRSYVSSTTAQISPLPSTEAQISSLLSTLPQISSSPSAEPHISSRQPTELRISSAPSAVPQISSPSSTKLHISSQPPTVPQISSPPSAVPQISSQPSTVPQISSPPSAVPQIPSSTSTVSHISSRSSTTPQISSSPSTVPQISSRPSTVPHISSPPSTESHISSRPPTVQQISSPPSIKPKVSSPSSVDVDASMAVSSLLSMSTDETINILLLGETGVGKSTFINAFANYLTFNTLQQAQRGDPVVLIPVSFLITVGDNFDEHIVKFGDINDSKNEDFHHPGQSVTQCCKSYVFDLNHISGKKLRIIDTPGFGDTRGIDQDDHNMQHILDYIKNLSHLNAICFLLKPNESRLNISYRSCLIQLFSFLNSNPCDNIIFCFTNARSTFYTLGDTAPLLKKMLSSLPMGNVPFKKDNAFCFDSESFRYLVALQNGISFNELEKEEYEMSWTKSVTESNRLVHYIYEVLTAYHMQTE